MQSHFIVVVSFLAATGISQPTARYTNHCATAPNTTPALAHTITSIINNIAGRSVVVVDDGLCHNHKYVLGLTIFGAVVGSLIVIALVGYCIMRLNWSQFCGKLPGKTSKGVRVVEPGPSEIEERNANPGVEVAQSDGHPFMNMNMIGGEH